MLNLNLVQIKKFTKIRAALSYIKVLKNKIKKSRR
mgnify:CR=1 FL=1